MAAATTGNTAPHEHLKDESGPSCSSRIGIIAGSTRPGANGAAFAAWVHSLTPDRAGFEYEVISLAEWKLPLFDEPVIPAHGGPSLEHTKAWSAKIASLAGFVFVSCQVSSTQVFVLGACFRAGPVGPRPVIQRARTPSVTAKPIPKAESSLCTRLETHISSAAP